MNNYVFGFFIILNIIYALHNNALWRWCIYFNKS